MDTTNLVTPEQHGNIVATVLDNNPDMKQSMAARIVDEALKYVAVCAAYPTAPIEPSRVVDEGWHALILHTTVYANMCEQLGMFVHHYPERPDPARFDAQVIDRTTTLIEEIGYSVDYDLWTALDKQLVPVAASCQHSDQGGPIVTQPKPKG